MSKKRTVKKYPYTKAQIDETLGLLGLIGTETEEDVKMRITAEKNGVTRVEHSELTWDMIARMSRVTAR